MNEGNAYKAGYSDAIFGRDYKNIYSSENYKEGYQAGKENGAIYPFSKKLEGSKNAENHTS